MELHVIRGVCGVAASAAPPMLTRIPQSTRGWPGGSMSDFNETDSDNGEGDMEWQSRVEQREYECELFN